MPVMETIAAKVKDSVSQKSRNNKLKQKCILIVEPTFSALVSYFPWTSSSSIGQHSNSSLCHEDTSMNIGGRWSAGEHEI